MDSEKHICVWLNKKGRVVEVRRGRRKIKPVRLRKRGELEEGEKGVLPNCEEILKVLCIQLLACTDGGGKGSDPCWVVDPATGEGFFVC